MSLSGGQSPRKFNERTEKALKAEWEPACHLKGIGTGLPGCT